MRAIVACSALAFALATPAFGQNQSEELEPAAGAGTDTSAEQVPVTDALTFARKAAASNRFEIESSEIVLQYELSPEVQEFAQRMVDDHTMAGQTLQDIVAEREILEEEELGLDEDHAVKLTELQEAAPEEAEQLYVDMQVKAHEQAVALFEGFAENGDDPELQAFAEQTLPTLREHKEMIDRIAGNAG